MINILIVLRESRASLEMAPGLTPANVRKMLLAQMFSDQQTADNFSNSKWLVWVDDLFSSAQPHGADQTKHASSHEVIRELVDSAGLVGLNGNR